MKKRDQKPPDRRIVGFKLDESLIARLRHATIELDTDASRFVAEAIEERLGRLARTGRLKLPVYTA